MRSNIVYCRGDDIRSRLGVVNAIIMRDDMSAPRDARTICSAFHTPRSAPQANSTTLKRGARRACATARSKRQNTKTNF